MWTRPGIQDVCYVNSANIQGARCVDSASIQGSRCVDYKVHGMAQESLGTTCNKSDVECCVTLAPS